MNLPTGAKTTSIASGPNLPAECRPEAANVFFKTTSPIGMHQCLTEGEWSEIAGGGGGVTSLAEHQIGFGSASNTVTGDAGFTFDPTFGGVYALKTILDSPASGDARLAQFKLTLSAMASVDAVYGAEIKVVTDGDTTASSATALSIVSYPDTVTGDSVGIDIYTGPASAANAYGIRIDDVTGGMTNQAIKTGLGDIVFGSLAGTGSRAVVADANGKLSAP